jgi:hypothetical protein
MSTAGDAQVRPGDLPTPFTAAQIRAASPDGHTVETRTEEDGVVIARHRITFLDGNDDDVAMRHVALDQSGEEMGEPAVGRATWHDLQAHASFPAAATVRTVDSIETPMGELECVRYEVRRDDDTLVFWFAVDHPGMPVHRATLRDGEPVSVTTVVSVGD